MGKSKINLDVMAGVDSPGYIASRIAWMGISVLIAMFAGLVYAPHRPRMRKQRLKWLSGILSPGAPRPANPNAAPARRAWLPLGGLLISEMRLIGQGRLWLLFAAVFRYSSLATLLSALGGAIVAWYLTPWPIALSISLIVPLVWVRHHANIRRLLGGTEPKIGQRTTSAA